MTTEEIRYLIREHIERMREIDYLLRDSNLAENLRWRLINEREKIERRTLLLMRKLDFVEMPS
ncbi:MAG: hypothetical protein OEW84_06335 [Aigarchaeota archaeon]|nr:hypothetical protein [Aigarchaeota archaeon]